MGLFWLVIFFSIFEEFHASGLGSDAGAKLAPQLFSFGVEFYTKFWGLSAVALFLSIFLIFVGFTRTIFLISLLFSLLILVYFLLVSDASLRGTVTEFAPCFNFLTFAAFGKYMYPRIKSNSRFFLNRLLFCLISITILKILVVSQATLDRRFVPFYDGVTLTLFAAIIVFAYLEFEKTQFFLIFCLSLFLILVIWEVSNRRAVFFTSLIALAFMFLMKSRRTSPILILATFCSLLALLAVNLGEIRSVYDFSQSQSGPTRTFGHFQDLRAGYTLCAVSANFQVQNFQSFSLVSKSSDLYVHNQVLQTCLSLGRGAAAFLFLGMISLLAFVLVLSRRSNLSSMSGFFMMIIIVGLGCSLWFANLTESIRWQFFFGFAIGFLLSEKRYLVSAKH